MYNFVFTQLFFFFFFSGFFNSHTVFVKLWHEIECGVCQFTQLVASFVLAIIIIIIIIIIIKTCFNKQYLCIDLEISCDATTNWVFAPLKT